MYLTRDDVQVGRVSKRLLGRATRASSARCTPSPPPPNPPAAPRPNHHPPVNLRRHIPRQHIVQEEHPPLLRQLQHRVAGGDDFGRQRRVGPAFQVAVRQAQVPWAMLGEGQAGDGEGLGGPVQGLLVFELDAEHDLAFGVQRPDVGLLEVLRGR